MERKYIIDPYKLGIASLTILFCLIIVITIVFVIGEISGVIFILPVVPFLYVAYLYGGTVEVNSEGIKIRRLHKVKNCRWENIREVGVLNTNLYSFSRADSTKGHMYIYFSPYKLTEEGRFSLALKWPKKNIDYIFYTKERMDFIRPLWDKSIIGFNTGEAKF